MHVRTIIVGKAIKAFDGGYKEGLFGGLELERKLKNMIACDV